ncbi:MAG: hypothetical protein V1736_06130 [Pseudomonadota bacterium]
MDIDKCPDIALDVGSESRRIKGHISGYVTLDATQKPDQKTGKICLCVSARRQVG